MLIFFNSKQDNFYGRIEITETNLFSSKFEVVVQMVRAKVYVWKGTFWRCNRQKKID